MRQARRKSNQVEELSTYSRSDSLILKMSNVDEMVWFTSLVDDAEYGPVILVAGGEVITI